LSKIQIKMVFRIKIIFLVVYKQMFLAIKGVAPPSFEYLVHHLIYGLFFQRKGKALP